MKRISPIYLLIALNIVLILFRDVILPDETSAALAEFIESTLRSVGVFGYVGIVAGYLVCAFFFVPLLVPLNILGGALYGAYAGTAVALVGITAGTIASTISARHVFTGMQRSIDKSPRVKRLLGSVDRKPNLSIALVRFAVIVPYLIQNIALAATNLSMVRLVLVTVVTAIPGAAIYSLLGAGLVRADQVSELLLYIGAPIAFLLVLSALMAYFSGRSENNDPPVDMREEGE